jgi:hypothetical protein
MTFQFSGSVNTHKIQSGAELRNPKPKKNNSIKNKFVGNQGSKRIEFNLR